MMRWQARLVLALVLLTTVLALGRPTVPTAAALAPAGPTGVIATLAGGGTLTGDGVAAADAQIMPLHVAAAPNGDIYFTDLTTCRVRKVSGGVVTTVAGTGTCGRTYNGDNIPATSAVLGRVEGIAIDEQSNVFLADSFRCSVRRVDAATQMITTVAGLGYCSASVTPTSGLGLGATSTSLDMGIIGIAIHGSDLYIAEPSMCRVDVVRGGVLTLFAGAPTVPPSAASCPSASGDGGPAAAANLHNPNQIATDPSGAVYFTDGSGGCDIRKVSAGVISTIATPCWPMGIGTYGGLAVDSAGTIFVADTANCNVRALTASTTFTIAGSNGPMVTCALSGDGGAAMSATLNSPYDVALDGAGNLYVTDVLNTRIRVIYGATVADRGDTDSDGYPDIAEAALGTNPSVYCPIMRADVNGDGIVNILDLALEADYYHKANPPARYLQGPPPFAPTITILDLAKTASVYLKPVRSCP